ncbi:MAG: hypothetical protein HOW73_28140 [Polyangiaceae bacterium]|nr:hypothetical protein [Polyangiaceae bacterium]
MKHKHKRKEHGHGHHKAPPAAEPVAATPPTATTTPAPKEATHPLDTALVEFEEAASIQRPPADS